MRGAEIIRRQRIEAELAAMEAERAARAAELAILEEQRKHLNAVRNEAFNAIKQANQMLRQMRPEWMNDDTYKARRNPDDMQRIASRLCRAFGVTLEEVRSPRRQRDISLCRHAIMYWCVRRTRKSTPQIAKFLCKLDHTTVLHGKNVYPIKRAAMGRHLRAVR